MLHNNEDITNMMLHSSKWQQKYSVRNVR